MLLHDIAGQWSELSTKKKQACENNYFTKFWHKSGFNTTASVTKEEDKEAKVIRQLLANNPLPYEDELMEMPIDGS